LILVDTSIWIDHFREGDNILKHLLDSEEVLTHPFVIGELACGNLKNRAEILSLLQHLPKADVVSDLEALSLIENRTLMGRGIGYVDVHLLAATLISTRAQLWSHDKRLAETAQRIGVAFFP
jgi:predicted nucleic acid-binding protein